MKRVLLGFLSLLLCSLGYSQITAYSYTLKIGPANNQVTVYAKPIGSGSAMWTTIDFVVGFQTSAGVPAGTWATDSSLNTRFGIPYVLTADNKGTSVSPAGYSYDAYTLNPGPGVLSSANLTEGTEYPIGTITYNLPGGVPFQPYLLDFSDAGSSGDANTFICDAVTRDYYTPTYNNASFYGAPSGGYNNSGSQLVNIGGGNSAVSPTITLLPLKLLSFTAAKQSGKTNTAALSWRVAEQVNTSSFEVERSIDGANYSKIGTVDAAGSYAGKKDYSFTDANAAAGSNYYRLKMVDIDGKYTYSPVKTVLFDGTAIALQIMPNPTQNVCYIKGLTQPAVVKLLDMNGRVLLVQNGVTSASPLNVASLPRAVYLVQVTQNGQTSSTLKLIKE